MANAQVPGLPNDPPPAEGPNVPAPAASPAGLQQVLQPLRRLSNRIWSAFSREEPDQRFLVAVLVLISGSLGALIPRASENSHLVLSWGLTIGILALMVEQPLLTWWKYHRLRTQSDDRVSGLIPDHDQPPISATRLYQLLGVQPGDKEYPFIQQAIGNLVWFEHVCVTMINDEPHYRFCPDD
jgi:hypothetical protein